MDDLLLLVHRIPYPPNKGDKIRSFHLLRFLAQRYRVHLGAFVDDAQDWAHQQRLQDCCTDTCLIGLDPRRAKLRSLTGLLSAEALSVAYYRNAAMAAWVKSKLAAGIRRVVVFSSVMAQYVEHEADDVCCIVDFCDVDSDKWRQYAAAKSWPLSWLYRRESERLLAFDRRIASVSRAALFVSEGEAALFRRLAPESAEHTDCWHNGVDTAFFDPALSFDNPFSADAASLTFTGAMDYWANVDAVVWFAREVLPRVREVIPSAQFWIVGGRPTADVRALAALPGVHVTGGVPDVRPYVAHAQAVVAPLRIARGVQNKVLEAMAMAKPVLATRAAMDGIEPNPAFDALVADSVDDLAARTVALLHEGDVGGLGTLGRHWVEAHYNWERNLASLARWLQPGQESWNEEQ